MIADTFPTGGRAGLHINGRRIERGVWIGSLAAAEHQNRTDEHNGSVQGERKGVALNTHGAKVRRLLVHFSSLVRNLLPEERLISNTWYP